MPLSFPGSHCYRCGRAIKWYDNIPLLSYWVLRGRCRQCGAPFSSRYFWVELVTALLFVLAYGRIGPSLALIPAYVFISLLIIATFTDIDHWIIPDRVSLGGLAAGIALAAVWPIGQAAHNPLAGSMLEDIMAQLALVWTIPHQFGPLFNSLAGALAGFLIMWGIGALGAVIFRKEAMGWGDIKLFAMFGAFCGLEPLLYILIISCFIGTLVGLAGMWIGRSAARRPVNEAIAPLVLAMQPAGPPMPEGAIQFPQPSLSELLLEGQPIGGEEREAVLRALDRPGALGPVRHHLPFGPSLAVAALVVYLFGDLLSHWFSSLMLGPDFVL